MNAWKFAVNDKIVHVNHRKEAKLQKGLVCD